MAYEVLMHSAPYASNIVVFMKALPDGAVYFKTPDGSRQYILNLPAGAARARGGDVTMALRAMLINKNLKTTPAELNKAASAVIGKNTIQHGYSFVYDDDNEESDYLEGHLQHHGILGMKWGVRRYQNADGSLTAAGRVHYNRNDHNYKRVRENVAKAGSEYEKKIITTKAQVDNQTRTYNRNIATSLVSGLTSGAATAITSALGMSAATVLTAGALPAVVGSSIVAGRSIYSLYNSVRIGQISDKVNNKMQEIDKKDKK